MPRSLRVARVLLVGAAAASVGVAAFIFLATSDRGRAAPILLVFVLVAALFLVAGARAATNIVAARLYALSGACALAGLGVLTGFGAGILSFPAAALGIVAAASLFASADRRLFALGVVAYVLAGVLIAVGLPFSAFSVFVVVLWPLYIVIIPGGAITILAGVGIAGGLASLAIARDRGVPLTRIRATRLALVAAIVGGVVAIAIDVIAANLDASSSARFELAPVALAIVFVAGAGAGLALASFRDAPPLAALGAALAVSIGLFIIVSGPAVRCMENGVSTNATGPWYLGYTSGPVSSSGGSSSGGSSSSTGGSTSGEMRRPDGIVVRYRCEGARVSEFVIER